MWRWDGAFMHLPMQSDQIRWAHQYSDFYERDNDCNQNMLDFSSKVYSLYSNEVIAWVYLHVKQPHYGHEYITWYNVHNIEHFMSSDIIRWFWFFKQQNVSAVVDCCWIYSRFSDRNLNTKSILTFISVFNKCAMKIVCTANFAVVPLASSIFR